MDVARCFVCRQEVERATGVKMLVCGLRVATVTEWMHLACRDKVFSYDPPPAEPPRAGEE